MKRTFFSLKTFLMVAFVSINLMSCGSDEKNSEETDNSSKTPTEEQELFCPDSNHPHAIDLGLPSGTKWACCNIGANSPEGYGGYYQWGETEEKSDLSIASYKYSYFEYDERYSNMEVGRWRFKYISNISGTVDDVAYVKWGTFYHMPTYDQFEELRDKCNWSWTTYNNVNGMKIVGTNGHRIFLPATGYAVVYEEDDRRIEEEGRITYYWAATFAPDYDSGTNNNAYAYSMCIMKNGTVKWANYISKNDGLPVRAVSEKNATINNGNNNNSDEAPYFTHFDFDATQTSVTVRFYTDVHPTNATIKYGTNKPSQSVSSTIAGKQISATIRGLQKGTKYYVNCTAKNNSGSTTSDTYSVITNY